MIFILRRPDEPNDEAVEHWNMLEIVKCTYNLYKSII
jgi:hypothetical protein